MSGITATPSTCPNNGSISVSATSPVPPLVYSIIAGPVTQSSQTNPVFNSLPSGNYTIRIADGTGNDQTVNATVGGSYEPPLFDITPRNPFCPGHSDGQLTGVIRGSTGASPFSWELLAPSPVVVPPQNNGTFTGLPVGSYQMRVTDACGSARTNAAVLFSSNPTMNSRGVVADKVGCDSLMVSFHVGVTELKLPFSLAYYTSNGTFIPTSGTTIDTSRLHSHGFIYIDQIIPGLTYGDHVQVSVTNACGTQLLSPVLRTDPFVFYPSYTPNECSDAYRAWYENRPPNMPYTVELKGPLAYTYTNLTTGTVHASGAISNPNYGAGFTGVIPGNTYRLELTDGCGESFSQNYTIPSLSKPLPTITQSTRPGVACLDSVLSRYEITTTGFGPNQKMVILSGPPTMGSTQPEYAYSDTYTYPSAPIPRGNSTFNGNIFAVYHLAPGTYHYKLYDGECGPDTTGSFTITPQQVSSLRRSVTVKKGCPGEHKILFSMGESYGSVTIRDIPGGNIIKTRNFNPPNISGDSALHVPPGQYEVFFEYRRPPHSWFNPINDNLFTCWTIRDTVTVPPYDYPGISTGNAILCNNEIHIEVALDTNKGVPPFQYEIISGPQTFPQQNENLFTVNTPGTYHVRVYDACGSTVVRQVTVDTLSFEPVSSLNTCDENRLGFPPSVYYTYHWRKPNGQLHIGDSLILAPVTPADLGTYNIMRIVDIDGCKDTSYITHTVREGIYSEQTVQFCVGDTVIFNNNAYTQAGIYADTLLAQGGCDSISVLKMEQKPFTYDSVITYICQGDSMLIDGIYRKTSGLYTEYQPPLIPGDCPHRNSTQLLFLAFITDTTDATICPGGSYIFGNVTYATPGIYTDTLTSQTSCDTIHVLRLSFDMIIGDSISNSICAGGSYSFGGNTLTQPGIYTDTISSITGCDSLVVLTLGVLPYLTDTVNANICQNGSYFFGGNILTQPGIYTDTLTAVGGCDSIVVLTLDILPFIEDSVSHAICIGATYSFGGNLLIQPGIYTDTLTATGGCDSIVVLTLDVLSFIENNITVSICAGDSYFFGGNILTQLGVYIDTLLSVTGCDSIVTLTLDVLPYITSTVNANICQGGQYNIGGTAYTLPGTYSITVPGTICDSIITLNLSVTPFAHDTVHASICEGDKYPFAGTHYTQPGMYSHLYTAVPCDSMVTLDLSVTLPPRVEIATGIMDNLVQLQAHSVTYPLTYLWTSSDAMLSDATSPNPTAAVHQSAWISVLVTDQYGCRGTDAIQIHEPLTSSLYIPNTYTPNGDVNNEYFRVYATNLEEFEIMIFNRWGELLLETRDVNFIWDGTYMGDPVQIGMYVYKLVARGTDAVRYDHIGHITVVR